MEVSDNVTMPFHNAGTDEQLSSDLEVGQAVAGQPGGDSSRLISSPVPA